MASFFVLFVLYVANVCWMLMARRYVRSFAVCYSFNTLPPPFIHVRLKLKQPCIVSIGNRQYNTQKSRFLRPGCLVEIPQFIVTNTL